MAENESLRFRRNRYYPSKLLTAESFTLEQEYFINKRKFLNQMLYCGGIIHGLTVTGIGEKAVTVSPGAAIDYKGNEIIVSSTEVCEPETSKIDAEKGYAYLCLEYEQEPVSLTFAPLLDDGERDQADIMEEKYKITWNYEAIGTDRDYTVTDELSGAYIYWNRGIIYQCKDFIITQRVPRFVRPGCFFEFRVDVIRLNGFRKDISFSYRLRADKISESEETKEICVYFSTKNHAWAKEYNLSFSAFAAKDIVADKLAVSGRIGIESDGKIKTYISQTPSWDIEGTERDIGNLLREKYQSSGGVNTFRLYLAEVYFDIPGYKVKDIRNVPFGQYLDGWRLNGILQDVLPSLSTRGEMITETAVNKLIEECKAETRELSAQLLDLIQNRAFIASGRCPVGNLKPFTYSQAHNILTDMIAENCPVEEKLRLIELLHICDRREGTSPVVEPELLCLDKNANTFEIKNIYHGLGPGDAEISCGIGTSEVTTGIIPGVELSIVADTEKGCFTIKGRLLENYGTKNLTVVWHAVKKGGNDELSEYPALADINKNRVELQLGR